MFIIRRDRITTAAAAGPAHLLGGSRARAAVNDRIRVAVIGLGGRGRDHMRDCAKVPGVKVVAFCDPDETRMAERATEFESLTGKKPALQQRSEEHTSELQSHLNLVCRLLLQKKKH